MKGLLAFDDNQRTAAHDALRANYVSDLHDASDEPVTRTNTHNTPNAHTHARTHTHTHTHTHTCRMPRTSR